MEVLARILQVLGAAALLGPLVLWFPGDPPAARLPIARRLIRGGAVLAALCLTTGAALDLVRLASSLVLAPRATSVLSALAAVVGATTYGQVLVARWILGLILAALLFSGGRSGPEAAGGKGAARGTAVPAADAAHARPVGGRAAALWVTAALFALALGAGGHAAAAANRWLVIPLQALHTAAAAGWFGGLVLLAVLSCTATPAGDLSRAAGRFSRFGLLAMIVLAATGALVALTRLFSPYDLVETNYGLRLGVKLAWVGGVLGFAALNRFLIVPRLASGQPAATRPLRVGLAAETVLGLGVLIFAGVLATTPPPLGPADRYVVYMDEYSFEPAELTVRAGRVARVVVINRGQVVHDWSVPEMPYIGGAVTGGDPHDHGEGMVHVHVGPGGRAAVEFIPLRPGRYRLLCTVWPHAERGMLGWVVVTE